MRKFFLFLALVLSSTLFAADVNWAKDFNSGVALAKKSNKPILFVSSRHSCKYCVILDETTFKDKKVVEELNKNFVSIVSYSDENDYMPDELYRPGTPAIWFLKSSGEPMYEPLMGAIKSPEFLQALSIVKDEFKKVSKTK
jgi:thioredoxin-related protein